MWNTRPAASTGVLANRTVVGTAGAWYELDLTAYLQQQKSAGAAALTLALRNAVVSDAQSWFNADEAATNKPRYYGCRHCYRLTYTSCNESRRFDGLFRFLGRDRGLDAADVKRVLGRRFA